MLNYLNWPAIYCQSHLHWSQVLVRDPGPRRHRYLVLLGWEGIGTFVHLSSLYSFVLFLANCKMSKSPIQTQETSLWNIWVVKTITHLLASIPSVAQGRDQRAALPWPSSVDPYLHLVLDLNTSRNILTDCTFRRHIRGPYRLDRVVLGKLAFSAFIFCALSRVDGWLFNIYLAENQSCSSCF